MRDWVDLLSRFPFTGCADVEAVPESTWSSFQSKATARDVREVTAAFERRLPEAIYHDANLEGIDYSETDAVHAALGTLSLNHADGENAQVQGTVTASRLMLARVEEGKPLNPSQRLSDEIHVHIAAPLGLKSIEFRGDQDAQYVGPRVSLGRGQYFEALDARLTHDALEAGLERINRIEHPVVRGATWAAFATYQQFYLDGNKRTARNVMNATLLSHGYDAIVVPHRLKAEYADALVESYRTGNLDAHIGFLLDLYDDSH